MSALILLDSLIKVVEVSIDHKTANEQDNNQLIVDLNVTEQQIIETRDIYQKHIKTWGTGGSYTQLADINILYGLTVSRIQSNNLLLNLIDSYRRDKIADLIHIKETNSYHKIQSEEERVKKWISSRPFIKQLQDKVQNTTLDFAEINAQLGYQATNRKNEKCELNLQTLIQTYPRRIAPGFESFERLIDDNLEAVSQWIVASSQFLHLLIDKETNQIGGPPCMIDFMILLNPSISNQDTENKDNKNDDDDDDDLDALMDAVAEVTKAPENIPTDIVGNFVDHLKKNNCKLSTIKFCDITEEKDAEGARKIALEAFRELREQVQNNNGSYPMNHRFNVIVDRRDIYKTDTDEGDKLIVFEPPSDCNKLSNVSLAECYFDLSRLCLIPQAGYLQNQSYGHSEIEKLKQETISAKTHSQGQILTLSYHIWAADEIKCYLFWNGLCHRFYPQDILELLPYMFRKDSKNADFAASAEAKELITKMSINDAKFETFYSKVNGLNKFPKIQ
eukprot:465228_1